MRFALSTAFCDPAQYGELARAADLHGWDAIAVSDHVVHPTVIRTPYPYTEDGSPRWDEGTPWPDPWLAIAHMAAQTERLRFLTSVYVLPLRNPFLVAKAVSSAAVFSEGRVALGIGVGWMKDEFELMEQGFHDRGRRTDEMVEVLRKLWTGERVEHEGRHYRFPSLRMLPKPPPIPIYVGGLSAPALRRAARLGDGWLSDLHTTEELRGLVHRLHELRREAGRADEPFEITASCSDAFDLDGYRRLEEIGVTRLLTMPWVFYGGDQSRLQTRVDGIRRFADEIIAKL